jgi:methionyl aminopeptidase
MLERINYIYFNITFALFCSVANNDSEQMKAGMTFTIEPVLSQGMTQIEILDDGWTACTVDNSRTAQIEHTILITETGCEILTS